MDRASVVHCCLRSSWSLTGPSVACCLSCGPAMVCCDQLLLELRVSSCGHIGVNLAALYSCACFVSRMPEGQLAGPGTAMGCRGRGHVQYRDVSLCGDVPSSTSAVDALVPRVAVGAPHDARSAALAALHVAEHAFVRSNRHGNGRVGLAEADVPQVACTRHYAGIEG